jgi:hypothetical protein
MSGRKVSRRDTAAGGIAMLVLATAAAGQAKAEELDGELLALCREFHETIPVVTRLEDERDELPFNHPHEAALERQVWAIVTRRLELREAITGTPARTPEGLMAKARVALWETCDGGPEAGPISGSHGVAWSLARDILGRAG